MNIDSGIIPAVALPQDQRQMYQFQSVQPRPGQRAEDVSQNGGAGMSDREIGRDLKLSNATAPRFGDGIIRDFARFSSMIQSLESKRGARSASARGAGSGPRNVADANGTATPPQSESPSFDSAMADYQRAAEYAAYLGAMAVIVQNGVSGLKRLQQG